MRARDLMVSPVRTCDPGATLAEAGRAMWEGDCGAIPVVNEHGQVLGMITDRDICIAASTHRRGPADIAVGEVISNEVVWCSPDDAVRDVLRWMGESRVRRVPVLEPGGRLVGLLALNDAVRSAVEIANGDGEVRFDEVMDTLRQVCRHADRRV